MAVGDFYDNETRVQEMIDMSLDTINFPVAEATYVLEETLLVADAPASNEFTDVYANEWFTIQRIRGQTGAILYRIQARGAGGYISYQYVSSSITAGATSLPTGSSYITVANSYLYTSTQAYVSNSDGTKEVKLLGVGRTLNATGDGTVKLTIFGNEADIQNIL